MVILTFSSGLGFYNHAVYLNALAELPAFTVSTASMAVSVFFLSSGFAGLVVAHWVDRYDPRICITAGAVLSCLCLCVLGYVQDVWQLLLIYTVLGAGFAASALIPATTLVTRWFKRRRAMVLSIASTGLSLGGIILTPLSVLLVDELGFTSAMPYIGGLYLLGIIPITWFWLRPHPEAINLQVPVDAAASDETDVANANAAEEASHSTMENKVQATASESLVDGISLEDARRTRFFWGLGLGYIFLMMAQVGGIAHQYGLAREQLDEAATALAVAILPTASIIGRLIGGWIVENSSTRTFAIVMMVIQFLSLALLAAGFSVTTLCLGLFLFGATVGNLLMLHPLIVAEAFGVKDYARIFSVNNLLSSWGFAIGPGLLGYIYATNHNLYQLPYLCAAVISFIGLCFYLAGGRAENLQNEASSAQ